MSSSFGAHRTAFIRKAMRCQENADLSDIYCEDNAWWLCIMQFSKVLQSDKYNDFYVIPVSCLRAEVYRVSLHSCLVQKS